MSEKRRPTYDLNAFKEAFSTVKGLQITVTASRSAAALGFMRKDIVDVIQTMRRDQFDKSMTSHGDHRIWQDVYTIPSIVGDLYVKFTAGTLTEFLLLSFKEKDDG